jgi:hypothetical protein
VNAGLFWLGILLKRIPGFVKKYPAISIFLSVVAPGLLVFNTKHLSLNSEQSSIALYIITLLVFVKSLKFYDITPVFIRYSNTKLTAKGILSRYILGRAALNIMPLFLFYGCAVVRLIILDFDYYTPAFFIKMACALFLFSLCALCLLFLHNRMIAAIGGMAISISILASIAVNHAPDIVSVMLSIIVIILMASGNPALKTQGKGSIKLPIHPAVKSSLYDFFGSVFLQDTIVVIVLFIALLLRIIAAKQIDDAGILRLLLKITTTHDFRIVI